MCTALLHQVWPVFQPHFGRARDAGHLGSVSRLETLRPLGAVTILAIRATGSGKVEREPIYRCSSTRVGNFRFRSTCSPPKGLRRRDFALLLKLIKAEMDEETFGCFVLAACTACPQGPRTIPSSPSIIHSHLVFVCTRLRLLCLLLLPSNSE